MSTENSKNADSQYNKMVNTPVWKLVSTLAIPTIISMMVTSIYNMADTFFVSQISTEASAAVGIVFPIMSIIQAFGFTFGMGSGSLISIKLGQKKNEEASSIASTAFFSALFVGLIILVFGNIFSSHIISLIGASDAVLPYANGYARYIFFGAPLMCASFVMNNDLRAEGKSVFSMVALTSGGILNMILDPIFIFVLDLGISGAAIATLISQTVSFSILVSWYLRKKSICVISIKLISAKASVYGKIIATGLPSLARQGLASFSSILLNTMAGHFGGDCAVAAMAIVTKISFFLGSIIIGVGQGFSPVSGYNYGAKKYDRVIKAWTFMVSSSFCLMLVCCTFFCIFSEQVIRSFRNDPAVIEIGKAALRYQCFVIPFVPFIMGTNMLMQSTRHVKQALFLSLNRQGVYFIPSILILSTAFGLLGVEISQAVADILSVCTTIPFMVWFVKKINKLKQENDSAAENE